MSAACWWNAERVAQQQCFSSTGHLPSSCLRSLLCVILYATPASQTLSLALPSLCSNEFMGRCVIAAITWHPVSRNEIEMSVTCVTLLGAWYCFCLSTTLPFLATRGRKSQQEVGKCINFMYYCRIFQLCGEYPCSQIGLVSLFSMSV